MKGAFFKFIYIACFLLILSADAAEHNKKLYGVKKVGNPYKIEGRIHHPKTYNSLVEEGYISWYGPGFYNKKTANGAIFKKNYYTAAHKTLQLPSIIEITNLENGKKVIAVVNDRGPFSLSQNRILDVSERIAEDLGFINKGVIRGKVRFLPAETQAFLMGKKVMLGPFSYKANTASCESSTITDQRNKSKNGSSIKGISISKESDFSCLRGSYIQVGAFKRKENALALVERLKKEGFLNAQARLEKKAKGINMIVVRIGPLDSDAEEKSLTKLKALGYDNARIIKVR